MGVSKESSLGTVSTLNSTDSLRVVTGDGASKRISRGDLKNAMKNDSTPYVAYTGGFVTSVYVKIGSMPAESGIEGLARNFSMLINGGNNYGEANSLIRLSATNHRGAVSSSANFIGKSNSQIALGYTKTGDIVSFWMKTYTYRHAVIFSFLYKAGLTLVVESSSTQPDGWVSIPIS